MFYAVDQNQTPTHEWYKPEFSERYGNQAMRQHIDLGGLAFRQIGDPDETVALRRFARRRERQAISIFRRLTNKKH